MKWIKSTPHVLNFDQGFAILDPAFCDDTDAAIALRRRIVGRCHIAEPVVVNGQNTGEWKVLYTTDAKSLREEPIIPWEQILTGIEAVREWATSNKKGEVQ